MFGISDASGLRSGEWRQYLYSTSLGILLGWDIFRIRLSSVHRTIFLVMLDELRNVCNVVFCSKEDRCTVRIRTVDGDLIHSEWQPVYFCDGLDSV